VLELYAIDALEGVWVAVVMADDVRMVAGGQEGDLVQDELDGVGEL
jgi:hypothetical protein